MIAWRLVTNLLGRPQFSRRRRDAILERIYSIHSNGSSILGRCNFRKIRTFPRSTRPRKKLLGQPTAKKVTRELVDKADALAELPRLGRVVPELGDENVREIPTYSYRILYEIRAGDAIVILAVIHKRRDLSPDEVG